jgi:type IV pilus assembly protein PilY1
VKNLIASTHGVRFGHMRYNGSNGGEFIDKSFLGATYTTTIHNMDSIYTGTSTTTNRYALMAAVSGLTAGGYTPLGETLVEALQYFEGGAPSFSTSLPGVSGGVYTSPIQYGCQKNYVVFVTDGMSTADDSSILDFVDTLYGSYDGGGCTNPPYTTCANNKSHSLAGVAKYMYEHDMRSDITGTQNVVTYTIGFGDLGGGSDAVTADDLLHLTVDNNHGHGQYFLAGTQQALASAFTSIMGEIFSVNTSFVAPVVPVSPENKTYSSGRVYMGFFKPQTSAVWSGNLKKFGLGAYSVFSVATGTVVLDAAAVFDVGGNLANYVDNNADGYDDRDGASLPLGTQNGGFRSGAISYWSTVADGGDVETGGVGARLLSRDSSIACTACDIAGTQPRHIYTYLGTNTDLTQPINAFSTTNTSLTPAILGLPGDIITSGTTTNAKKLINYVHGFDVYDANANGNTTEKRDWILGDILHSKPQIISYAVYSYEHPYESNEFNCSINKSIVYAGANDGMLHAFKDCDGSEAWAFIPPDLLPNLQYLQGSSHPYFVDSTVTSYVYQADPTAAGIDPATDKVVLVVGLRRGGGLDSEPTAGQSAGYYYALDVTDPVTPRFLWSISNTTRWSGTTKTATAAFSDMGESWSEPKIVKIKVGVQDKIAVFIGGGYDNCNEDARYGTTQTFSGFCVGAIMTPDGGLDGIGNPITSAGSTAVTSFTSSGYKGRAIYAVELATLNSSGVPNLGNGGTKIWGHTIADSPPLAYSIASELTAIDSNYDSYVDRIYAVDSGGNLWRINTQDSDTDGWTVTKIFSSNPGYTGDPGAGVSPAADGSKGRKIFYKPSVALDKNNLIRIFFGTGDREHPLNRAVTDRFYGLIDKPTLTTTVTEANMLDVSSDLIQNGTQTQVTTLESLLNQASSASDSTYYGWYMRIYGAEHYDTSPYQGEKILAPPTVMNGVVYFTTYAPSTDETVTDPCQSGNLGIARLYALDYSSGMAALNLDTSNDSSTPLWDKNTHAHDAKGKLLQRTDRTITLGSGIPSGVQPNGLVGCGGGLCKQEVAAGGKVLPLYWRQK